MASFDFESEVDRATEPITTTAQRDAIRTAIKTCRTSVNNALTALGLPAQSTDNFEVNMVDTTRQIGADAKNK